MNKQGGAERHETRAGAGELIDFDPTDPSIVKVHYDLSSWKFDQRAELSEALAENDLPHAWDGEELIVPEDVEAATDAMFETLEAEIGPFAIGLDADAESTEFGLDEWNASDRAVLAESLVESEIPHRWEGETLLVAADAEDAVDELLDAIESGELVSADEADGTNEPPEGALSDIFLAANKLAKEPFDARSRHMLIDMREVVAADHPPYAFNPRTWREVVAGIDALVTRVRADADGDRVVDSDDDDGDNRLEESSDVIGHAQRLRELLRPFI